MNLSLGLLERDLLPDALIRFGIRRLLRERLKEEDKGDPESQQRHLMRLIEQLKRSPIALNTAEANEQHYEVPTEFFLHALGPHRKYSSCYYPSPSDPPRESLEAAEARLRAGRAFPAGVRASF